MTSTDSDEVVLPMQTRIVNFVEQFMNYKDDLFVVKDMEIFPVTSKLIGYYSKYTNVKTIRIELKLKELNHDEMKISKRMDYVPNMFVEESNVNEIDISSLDKSEFEFYAIHYFNMFLH